MNSFTRTAVILGSSLVLVPAFLVGLARAIHPEGIELEQVIGPGVLAGLALSLLVLMITSD